MGIFVYSYTFTSISIIMRVTSYLCSLPTSYALKHRVADQLKDSARAYTIEATSLFLALAKIQFIKLSLSLCLSAVRVPVHTENHRCWGDG